MSLHKLPIIVVKILWYILHNQMEVFLSLRRKNRQRSKLSQFGSKTSCIMSQRLDDLTFSSFATHDSDALREKNKATL